MTEFNEPFPHAPRKDIKSPPIELIVAQFRFPTIPALYSNDGFIKFAEAVRPDYPRASPETEVALGLAEGRIQEKGRELVWKFEDLEADWTVTLASQFVALEAKQYKSFSEFRDRFTRLTNLMGEAYGVDLGTRLGLRYVDRFSVDKQDDLPEDWLSFVTPKVFADQFAEMSRLQIGKVEHRFVVPDTPLALTFRAQFRRNPKDASEDEFVLDVDAYDLSTSKNEHVDKRLNDLKELAHNAFWWTCEELLVKMGRV